MISINNFNNYDMQTNFSEAPDADEVKLDDFSLLLAAFSVVPADAKPLVLPSSGSTENETPGNTQPVDINQKLTEIGGQTGSMEIPVEENLTEPVQNQNISNIPAGNAAPAPDTDFGQNDKSSSYQNETVENNQAAFENNLPETVYKDQSNQPQPDKFNFFTQSSATVQSDYFNSSNNEILPANSAANASFAPSGDVQFSNGENVVVVSRIQDGNVPIVRIPDSQTRDTGENYKIILPPKIQTGIVVFKPRHDWISPLPALFRSISKDTENTTPDEAFKENAGIAGNIQDKGVEDNQNWNPDSAKTDAQPENVKTFDSSHETISLEASKSPVKSASFNLEILDTRILKSKNEQESPAADMTVAAFDKSLLSIEKNSNTGLKTAASSTVDGGKVFEQIEKHLHQSEIFIFTDKTEKTNILKLRLRPAELGAVEIKLEKSESGKLQAHFQTETEAARQTLVERSDQLLDTLQKSGWQIEKIDISCNLSSHTGGSERRDAQSQQLETVENASLQAKTIDSVSEDNNDSGLSHLISLRA